MSHSCPTCGQPRSTVENLSGHRVVLHHTGALDIDGQRWEVGLTLKEQSIIACMASLHSAGREYMTGNMIFDAVYADVRQKPDSTKIIHVMIYNIRQKLAGAPLRIDTIRKSYRLAMVEELVAA